MARLLLAGVCVAYMCSAGILLVFFLADRAHHQRHRRLDDGLAGHPAATGGGSRSRRPGPVLRSPPTRRTRLAGLWPRLAASRGVNVSRTIWACYAAVGVLTAVIVANCG
jgi:ABC-type Fe3+-siderophore transport system permease subunit